MACSLVVAIRAEADLAGAFAWYEARSRGLGHDFLRCVDAKLGMIARSRRAAKQASKRAIETNVPLVVWKDGKVAYLPARRPKTVRKLVPI